jgi:hypothetical protein
MQNEQSILLLPLQDEQWRPSSVSFKGSNRLCYETSNFMIVYRTIENIQVGTSFAAVERLGGNRPSEPHIHESLCLLVDHLVETTVL